MRVPLWNSFTAVPAFLCPSGARKISNPVPRVTLRPPCGVHSFTRGYKPSPRWGESRNEKISPKTSRRGGRLEPGKSSQETGIRSQNVALSQVARVFDAADRSPDR